MRWIRYETNGQTAFGIVDGDMVTEVRGDPFAGYEKTATRRPLSSVKLLVPVEPRTFYAAGLNYAEHAIAAANKRGEVPKLPEAADIGYRANNALIAHVEAIVIPADATERVQYEAELVAVIGRKAKHLSESEALSCVLGYTIGNDVSERTWQRSDRTLWRATNSDTFKPMGPFIVSTMDPMAQKIEVRINGRTVSSYSTSGMIFGVAHYISRMSRYLTLHPGDVIWFGCDGPTIPALQHGDLVEVENDAIGVLANRVVQESRISAPL